MWTFNWQIIFTNCKTKHRTSSIGNTLVETAIIDSVESKVVGKVEETQEL
jgi:hypothetical protein